MTDNRAAEMAPQVLEDRVARALEAARRRTGLTVEAMVKQLRPALRLPDAPDDRPIRWTWYDWRKNPRSVPAVALLAAAEMAGVPVDVLLGATSVVAEDRSGRTPVELEHRVQELSIEMTRLKDQVAELQVQLMDAQSATAGLAAPGGERAERVDEQRRRRTAG